MSEATYDVIVVGSGPGGASISRELALQGKKVLLLEQGSFAPVKETLSGIAAIAKEFRVGEGLKAMTGVTVGGTSNLYFGVCKLPTAETFTQLGVDFSREVEEIQRELPIAELPDEFLAPQSKRVLESAQQLGYRVIKNRMLIDQSQCKDGRYAYDAKWKPRSYVKDALNGGAKLITGATVSKVLVEGDRAVGVEYKVKQGLMGSRVLQARGKNVVLCAGSFSTPKLLMDCGIKDVGNHGYFCHAACMVIGTIPGLKGRDAFLGYRDIEAPLGNGLVIGDGTMNAALFRLVMLGNGKFRQAFSHAKTVMMGISINDAIGGEVKPDGSFHKRLTDAEHAQLKAAQEIAIKILGNAGAKNIFVTKVMAGIPGGLLKVGEHLNENLETRIAGLYVCDHSVITDVDNTPVVTLICLGRHLARHLVASLNHVQPQRLRSIAV